MTFITEIDVYPAKFQLETTKPYAFSNSIIMDSRKSRQKMVKKHGTLL